MNLEKSLIMFVEEPKLVEAPSLKSIAKAQEKPKITLNDIFDYYSFLKRNGFFYYWEGECNGKKTTLRKLLTLDPNAVKKRTKANLKASGKVEGQEAYNSVAAWMRKNNFDEIPQLWNLLRGQLKIIGPRLNPDSFWEEHFTGKGLELRKKYQPSAINADYAFKGKIWEETVENVTQWLIRYDESMKKYGHAIGPTIEALSKFLYRRLIKKEKSE